MLSRRLGGHANTDGPELRLSPRSGYRRSSCTTQSSAIKSRRLENHALRESSSTLIGLRIVLCLGTGRDSFAGAASACLARLVGAFSADSGLDGKGYAHGSDFRLHSARQSIFSRLPLSTADACRRYRLSIKTRGGWNFD